MSYLRIAAVLGAAAVALGAFGAHGLQGKAAPERLEVFNTGVRYHMWHTLAILALAVAPPALAEHASAIWACRLWTAGIVIFSGSLYLLVLLDYGKLGIVTPIGGVAMIAGWVALATYAVPK